MSYDLPPSAAAPSDRTLPLAVYGLYLAGFIVPIIPTIAAVVIAHVKAGTTPLWMRAHMINAVYMFWYAILFSIIALILTIVSFGILAFIVWPVIAIWFVVRCILGLLKALDGLPYPNPRALLL